MLRGNQQRDANRGVRLRHGHGSGSLRGLSVPPRGRAAHGVEPRTTPPAGRTIAGHRAAVLHAPGYRHALMR